MKRIFCLLGISLVSVLPVTSLDQAAKSESKPQDAPAAKAAAALPTVDQLLDKYVQAIGGKAAVEGVKSRVMKGTAELPSLGASVTWELYAKAPNKRITITEVPGFGTVRDGYNGKVAWSHNPAVGLSEKSGEELAKIKRDAEFNHETKLKTIYPDLAYKGVEKLGAEEAHVAVAKPSAGSSERFYFNVKTGLLVRQDSEFDTPAGKVQTVVHLEDYQTVDGLKLPFTLRLAINAADQPELIINLKSTEVKHNVPIEDAKFEKP